jgi:hypothetical protein
MEKNDQFFGIYCHYDGYPENTGKILLQDYTTPEKIEKLLTRGSIRALNPDIEQSELLDSKVLNFIVLPYDVMERGIEYVYLWKEGQWLCSSNGGKIFNPLQK